MVNVVPEEQRDSLLDLFETNQYLSTVSEALIRERLGLAIADSIATPNAALLYKDGIAFLAGDPDSRSTDELLEHVPANAMMITPGQGWHERLSQKWGSKLHARERTHFQPQEHCLSQLREIWAQTPAGTVLEPLTLESAQRLSSDAKAVIRFLFPSIEEFIETNFGYVVRDGTAIASVAFAGTPIYRNEFEMHGETHPDYRNRGLARVTAARLIDHAVENGLVPRCDADNPTSARAAAGLGFINPHRYLGHYWAHSSDSETS